MDVPVIFTFIRENVLVTFRLVLFCFEACFVQNKWQAVMIKISDKNWYIELFC